MPAHTPPPSTRSLLGLELLRFVCALSVLVWHYQHFFYVGDAPVGLVVSEQPLYALLKPFYLNGFLGVQAFWCLSGFIFFWKYARPVSGEQVTPWRFTALRFSRLYPLHLLTLLLVAALAAVYRGQVGQDYVYPHNDVKHFALQLFLASDWGWQDGWSFNGPIWSISIEILVYALFFGLSWLGWIRWWQVLVTLAVSGAVYGFKLTAHPVVLCVFFFYLGALTQQVHAMLASRPAQPRQLVPAGCLAALMVGSVLVSTGALRPMFYVALATPLATLLLLDITRPRTPRMAAWIALLGNTTYASYLIHFPLQLGLATLMAGQTQRLPLHQPAWLLAYLTTVFVLAAVVYRWVEVPAQAWLRRRLGADAPSGLSFSGRAT